MVEKGLEFVTAEIANLKNTQQEQFSRLEALITNLVEKITAPRTGSSNASHAEPSNSAVPADPPPVEQPHSVSAPVLRRLDIPTFHGDNPVDWLSRVDQYFILHPATDAEKINIALVAMEGAGMHWIRWLMRRKPRVSWLDLPHNSCLFWW